MRDHLVQAFMQTLTSPQDGLRTVLTWRLDRQTLWLCAVAIVLISVLMNGALVMLKPGLLEGPQLIPTSPFLQALVVWGGLVLTVYGAHYIGKMFGGEGTFDDSLHALIWLQAVLTVFQIVQLVLAIVSDAAGALLSLALMIYTIWLFVNFIAAVHNFKSLLMVFAGFIGSSIGVGFGLLILFSIIAVVTGMDIQNV